MNYRLVGFSKFSSVLSITAYKCIQQNRNRLTDTENKVEVTSGEREGEKGKIRIEFSRLP